MKSRSLSNFREQARRELIRATNGGNWFPHFKKTPHDWWRSWEHGSNPVLDDPDLSDFCSRHNDAVTLEQMIRLLDDEGRITAPTGFGPALTSMMLPRACR